MSDVLQSLENSLRLSEKLVADRAVLFAGLRKILIICEVNNPNALDDVRRVVSETLEKINIV